MLKHMSECAELSGADIVVCRSRSFNLQSLQYAPLPDSIRKDLLPEKAVFSPGDIERDFSGHLYGGHGTNYSDVNLLFSTR